MAKRKAQCEKEVITDGNSKKPASLLNIKHFVTKRIAVQMQKECATAQESTVENALFLFSV